MLYSGYSMMIHLKHMACLFASTVLYLCISGCSKNESAFHDNNKWEPYQFRLSESPMIFQGALEPTLQAYVFKGDMLLKKYNNLTVESDGRVEFLGTPNSTVYFLSGSTGSAELDKLQENISSLTDFLNLSTPVSAENTEPTLFYSGNVSVDNEGIMSSTVLLTPSVVRLDLKIKNNADIKVTKIVLEKVPLRTALFGTLFNSPMGTRTLEFPGGGISNKDNICHLYESRNYGIKAIVYATYSGTPCIRSVTFPPMDRGHYYTLVMQDVGTTVSTTVEAEPWIDGETVNTTDDVNAHIYLDPNNTGGTVIGDTTVIRKGTTTVRMSFLAPFEVLNVGIEGEGAISIERLGGNASVVDNRLLTSYRIILNTMASRGKIKVSMKNEDSSVRQDFYLKMETYASSASQ